MRFFPAAMLLTACAGDTASLDNKRDTLQKSVDSLHTLSEKNHLDSTKTIVVFGNSLTAGYGVDISEAFPARIQEKIDSLHLPYRVVNAGVSGETSAGGKNRIDWILQQPIDVFILELGANDGLRGIPVTETKKNLQDIIDKVKKRYPHAQLIMAGMQVPPNMGKTYTEAFKSVFVQLSEANNMALVSFLLEGVGGVTALNQADGIHPTAKGHRIVAENLWKVLGPEIMR